MISLENPEDRKKLANKIKEDIDAYCKQKYNEGHRKHLGASVMGKPCDRQLWYNFRWVKLEVHEGRVQRLFQVGHNAEPRFIEYLRGIGFEVKEFANQAEVEASYIDGEIVEPKQFRITGCNGHYGGSLDGMCKAPNIIEPMLLEFKTNGTGAGYAKVATSDLSDAKPEHWRQMCQYGYKMGLKYGLYLIENKNDSDITVKIVELDWNVGRECEKRAQDIINAKVPPQKISENPAAFECKFCSYRDICHYSEKVEVNCRSCRNATPVADGKWNCSLYGDIPDSFIATGCPQHVSVNGE